MKKHNFTLLEMVIVVVIVALLAAVVAPNYIKHLREARVRTAKAQIKLLESAVLDYELDLGSPPTETEGLEVLIRNVSKSGKWNGKYLKANNIPLDPWGNEYVYRCPGEEEDFAIISYGADGEAGGEGYDADLSSETLSATEADDDEN